MRAFRSLPLVVTLSVLAGGQALAHPDEGELRVREGIWFTESKALTDQDDGGGESEYCLSISITHPSHSDATTKSVICRDVDWDQDVPSAYADDDDDDADNEWEDIEELPLIGHFGAMGGHLNVAMHLNDCTETSSWVIETQLLEMDSSDIGEFLDDLSEALKPGLQALKVADPSPGASQAVQLVGDAATGLGHFIDELLQGEERLSRNDVEFVAGAGDPGQTVVATAPPSMDYTLTVEKRVSNEGRCAGTDSVSYRLPDYQRAQVSIGEVATAMCTVYDGGGLPICLEGGPAFHAQVDALMAASEALYMIQPDEELGRPPSEIRSVGLELIGTLIQDAIFAQLEEAEVLGHTQEDAYYVALEGAEFISEYVSEAVAQAEPEFMLVALQVLAETYPPLAEINFGEGFETRWDAAVDAAFAEGVSWILTEADHDRHRAGAHAEMLLEAFEELAPEDMLRVQDDFAAEHGVWLEMYVGLPTEQGGDALVDALAGPVPSEPTPVEIEDVFETGCGCNGNSGFPFAAALLPMMVWRRRREEER